MFTFAKKKTVSGLAITDRGVSYVTIEGDRTQLCVRELGHATPDEPFPAAAETEKRAMAIAATLRSGLKGRRLPQLVAVARQRDAKAHFAWLPSIDRAEIASMASFEIEKIAPMEADKYVADHLVIHTQGKAGSDCLFVALDRTAADSITRGASHAGHDLERLTLSGWAIFQAWAYASEAGLLRYVSAVNEGQVTSRLTRGAAFAPADCQPEAADVEESEGDKAKVMPGALELIVHLGIDSTDLILLKGGVPAFMRSSSLGLGKLLERLRQAGVTAGLDDFHLLDLDHIEFTLMAIRERTLVRSGVAFEDEQGGSATSAFAESSASFQAILDDLPEDAAAAPSPREEPAKVGQVLDHDIVSRTTRILALGEEEGADWGDTGADVVQTWLKKLLQEMKRTLVFANSMMQGRSIDRMTLCGPGAAFQSMDAYFSRNFAIPVATLDGLAGIPIERTSEASGKDADSIPALSPARRQIYLEAIGAALEGIRTAPSEKPLNLLPAWYVESRATGEKRRSIATSVMIGVIALAMVIVYLQLEQRNFVELKTSIEEENNNMAPFVREVDDMQDKLEIVRKHVDGSHSVLAVMDMIAQMDVVRNDRVRVNQINYERGKDVLFRGHAKSIADMNDFQISLNRSGFFLRTEQRDSTQINLNGTMVQQFDILGIMAAQITTQQRPGAGASGIRGVRLPGSM